MLTTHDATRIRRAVLIFVILGLPWLGGRPAAAEPVVITSTFDTDAEGWGIAGDGSGPNWVSTGGVEGGYISATDQGQGVFWYFRAPARFLGNKTTAYGQELSFSLKQSATDRPADPQPDVILEGAGLTLVFDTPADPGTAWTLYTVSLTESAGWRKETLAGPPATAAELQNVLADLKGLQIRGEYRDGPDSGGLDSVMLTLSAPPPPLTLPVSSTFDEDAEGWTVFGDAQGSSVQPTYVPTDGNPGGHVSAKDDVTGGVWYWKAPAKFLGNVSGAYGATLTFDLKQSSLSSQFDSDDVILVGGGLTLVYDTPNNPGTDWTHYVVPLRESAGWRRDALTGAAATEAELRTVLAGLVDLRIRGEFVTGADTGGLDNVHLGLAAPALLYGDADGNGVVGWPDVSAALSAAGGLRADANVPLGDVAPTAEAGAFGDGRLDTQDAVRIARYLRGLETRWP